MKNPILIDLLNYWEHLRAGRIAPLRSEVDPREIETALEHAFILERVAKDNVRFRLAGMQICDFLGLELRGMPATAIITPEDREDFSQITDALFTKPEILELDLAAQRPAMPALKAEMLMLPMRSDYGEISRILGCLVASGPIGAPPCRFSIAGQKRTRIVAAEAAASYDLLPGFSEPAASFNAQPTPASAKGQPYLRLVKPKD